MYFEKHFIITSAGMGWCVQCGAFVHKELLTLHIDWHKQLATSTVDIASVDVV